MPAPPGIPWGSTNFGIPDGNVRPTDAPYASSLVCYQFGDEQDITNPDLLLYLKTGMQSFHVNQPDVLTYTNQSQLQNTAAELQAYMSYVKPDMLCIDSYPFQGNPSIVVGGSPTELYVALEKYRKLGLAGNDGTGAQPIPVGLYTQAFKWGDGGHVVSESEVRLNNFSAWAFGCKMVKDFFYENVEIEDVLKPVMFLGNGTAAATPTFYQIAETNRQSLNLGPALVRLVSTDLRMKMGRHGTGTTNTLPDGVLAWSADAGTTEKYITSIDALNVGSKNNGLPGDVIVGYFKPLDASFTNSGHEDDTYFMIVNGLSDGTGLANECNQRIRLDFDFGDSGINSLQRLNRYTGEVDVVPLNHISGSTYYVDYYLEGGTGELFKFNNGGAFVPEPGTLLLLTTGLFGLLCCAWRKRKGLET